MPSPYQQISDRIATVRSKLGNRTNIDSLISGWLRDAYLELAMGVDFEELLDTAETPTVQGTSIYNYPTTDVDSNTIATRAIRSLTLVYSNNDTQIIYRKDVGLIDRYNKIQQGPPSVYAPWTVQGASMPAAPSRAIIVRPIPDAVYTILWRVWIKPTINSTVNNTYLQLPDDWLEILDYAAALRGFADLLESDRQMATQQLLFGAEDPRTGKRAPGLIEKRMTAMEAEAPAAEYGVRPKIGRFTSQVAG